MDEAEMRGVSPASALRQNRVKVRRRFGMKCWRDVTVDIERGPNRDAAI
jgi:hypothetical protein